MTGELWFKLFANCIVVSGYAESLLYDLGRNNNYPIPNHVADMLNDLRIMSINKFLSNYDLEYQEIEGLINQFLLNELGFLTNSPEQFPEIDLVFETPFLITNAIIELTENKNYEIYDVIHQLNSIGCPAIKILFSYDVGETILNQVLGYFNDLKTESLEILLCYNQNYSDDLFFQLINRYPRLRRIVLYSSPKDLVVSTDDILTNHRIAYTVKNVITEDPESIKKENFRFNLKLFSESITYNSGLNKKVCINGKGEIKNFLFHDKVYGHVSKDDILDLVKTNDFQRNWKISNDLIEKCKDCQFRYACVSNSDIIVNNSQYHKMKLCHFDPYTNKWSS